jgi:hypothetical protein
MFGASAKPYPYHQTDLNLADKQQVIYDFLLETVNDGCPARALEQFQNLFIVQAQTANLAATQALQAVLRANDQDTFRHTIKRSCYILVNNWETARCYSHIQSLVQGLDDPIVHKPSVTPMTRRQRSWVLAFIQSQDYQDLKLFSERFESASKNWYQRYNYYHLISQSENPENPSEQREAARILSDKLRRRFKLDLAIYVAQTQIIDRKAGPLTHLTTQPIIRSTQPLDPATRNLSSQAHYSHPSSSTKQLYPPHNPTHLGNRTLKVIKQLVMRKGRFSYQNLAKIFKDQVQGITYQHYKLALLNYLVFSVEEQAFVVYFKQQLLTQLDDLYPDLAVEVADELLHFRTCNYVIESLTITTQIEAPQTSTKIPSPLFTAILSQGGAITLAIFLLKLVLISPGSRNHLGIQIGHLLRYYQGYALDQCKWFRYFLDVLNVTLAIHTEGIDYNLLQVAQPSPSGYTSDPGSNPSTDTTLNPSHNLPGSKSGSTDYTIFSQVKSPPPLYPPPAP